MPRGTRVGWRRAENRVRNGAKILLKLPYLLLGLEGRRAGDGPEDLLLEDAHVVGAAKNGGLYVVAAGVDVVGRAAGEDLGPLSFADVDVFHDAIVLHHGNLRTHHGVRVKRVARHDGLGSRHDLENG